MAAYWFPPDAIATTANVVVVHVCTAAVTGEPFCTCQVPDPGFACVADRHATPDDLQMRAVLRALERQDEYRDFVGHPPAPRAVMSRASRRHRAGGNRRDQHAWRTRALGKRPGLTASG